MSARVVEPATYPRRHVIQFYDREDELAASVGVDFGVAVTRSADTVRISVRDGSPDAPLAPSREPWPWPGGRRGEALGLGSACGRENRVGGDALIAATDQMTIPHEAFSIASRGLLRRGLHYGRSERQLARQPGAGNP